MTRKPKPKIFMPNGEDARDCYGTPEHIFEATMRGDAVKYTVDACASQDNFLVKRYWTREKNALAQDWSVENVWCSPPYSNIEPFIAKAREANRCVMLLPVRSDRKWWAECAQWATFIDFYQGLVQLTPPQGVKVSIDSERLALVWFYKEIREGVGAICRARSAETGKLL